MKQPLVLVTLVLACYAGVSCASDGDPVIDQATLRLPEDAVLKFELRGEGSVRLALVDERLSPTTAVASVWRLETRWVRLVDGAKVGLDHHGWVGAAQAGSTLMAVADSRVEAPAWELSVLVSHDGGATWHPPVLVRKPYYMALLKAVQIDETGAGCLEIVLDDDYGASVTPGVYVSATSDSGRTWSAPRLISPGERTCGASRR